jgi:hypothetical protein
MIGNLCIYNQLYGTVLTTSLIEDSHYNQYLMYLANRQVTLEGIVAEIDSPYNLSVFLDTSIYFEEFIKYKHDPTKLNLYNLSIDDNYNIVVTNRQLKVYSSLKEIPHA